MKRLVRAEHIVDKVESENYDRVQAIQLTHVGSCRNVTSAREEDSNSRDSRSSLIVEISVEVAHGSTSVGDDFYNSALGYISNEENICNGEIIDSVQVRVIDVSHFSCVDVF